MSLGAISVAEASECGGGGVGFGCGGAGVAVGGVGCGGGSLSPGSSAGCANASEGDNSVNANTRSRVIVTLPASLLGPFPACPTVAAQSTRCQFARKWLQS